MRAPTTRLLGGYTRAVRATGELSTRADSLSKAGRTSLNDLLLTAAARYGARGEGKMCYSCFTSAAAFVVKRGQQLGLLTF